MQDFRLGLRKNLSITERRGGCDGKCTRRDRPLLDLQGGLSAALHWVGGVTMLTLAGVVAPVGAAFVVTFGMAFGLAQPERKSTIEH